MLKLRWLKEDGSQEDRFFGLQTSKDLQVTIAAGLHLFPFRTEKLSLPAPMVLQLWESRSSPTLIKRVSVRMPSFFLAPGLTNMPPPRHGGAPPEEGINPTHNQNWLNPGD